MKIHRNLGRLYVLDITIEQQVCLAALIGDTAWTWHACSGHLHFYPLRKMVSDKLVHGLPHLN
jgi:hypothetical protein